MITTTMIDMCKFLFRAFRVSGRAARVHRNESEDDRSSATSDLNIIDSLPEYDNERCSVTLANTYKWSTFRSVPCPSSWFEHPFADSCMPFGRMMSGNENEGGGYTLPAVRYQVC